MKKIVLFYKGFVITEESDLNIYFVAYSDIRNLLTIDDVKAEIDRNLAAVGKQVASYRGIPIVRKYQTAETVERNGEVMFDNGFYYQIPIHPFNGTLYDNLDDIRWSIDGMIRDRDDFYKKQFPVEYKQFMKLVNC